MILALARHRRPFGGTERLLLSALLEMLFAVVIAPVMMMYHSRFVVSVLSGHDNRWEPPVREARVVPWVEAWRNAAGTTAFGLAWAGLTLYCSPTFFLWLTPIFTGLLLAAPLVRGTSSRSLGQWTRRRGSFSCLPRRRSLRSSRHHGKASSDYRSSRRLTESNPKNRAERREPVGRQWFSTNGQRRRLSARP